MNVNRKILSSAAVAFAAVCLASCADNDIKGGNGNGNINGPLDPVEAYTRAFVKEFGEFKAQNWDQGVQGVISVRTSRPTQINVFADIEGQRFLFASLSSVYGLQPISVHIPDNVRELIVVADGVEHKTPLGELLDLSDGSRFCAQPNFVTDLPNFGDLTVNYQSGAREIELSGSLYNTWLNESWAFNIFDSEFNYLQPKATSGTNNIHLNSRVALRQQDTQFTVYPLYWRENVHGESDYMLGMYYYQEGVYNAPYDEFGQNTVLQHAHNIKMIDFEDFDVKEGLTFSWSASGTFTVGSTAAPNNVKTVAEVKKLTTASRIHAKGVHITLENMPATPAMNIGFYIKSGLKPGYTEGKGRNYTHITFQSAMYNASEWGDHYWDLSVKEIGYSYTGAVFGARSMCTLKREEPTHIDGIADEDLGVSNSYYYPIGFMSQPDCRASKSTPDFCDVVLALNLNPGPALGSVGPNEKGEGYGTYPWTLAAEDLGSTDDWDFNDLVVNVYDLTTDLCRIYTKERAYFPSPNILGRRITVVPKAAGGTYPIYLMYEGEVADDITDETMLSAINAGFTEGTYVVGTELHAWLGEPDYKKMLNTGLNQDFDGCAVSFCVPVIGSNKLDFDIQNPPQTITGDNQPIRNFWVLVDKEDNMRAQLENTLFDVKPRQPEYNTDHQQVRRHISETKNVLKPFNGKLGEGAYRVDQPRSGGSFAPQMLMCQYMWKWPKERQNIGQVYDNFRDWVAGKRQTWHSVTSEGNNGYDPTKVCEYTPVAWKQ